MTENRASVSLGNILIVDDRVDHLHLLSTTLSERGYKVRGAIKGKMALRAARSAPPDLIVIDIRLPDMSGYELCERLKADAQTREIPVIFLSALDEVLDKVKAFAIGGLDYITKPFEVEEVLVRIENQLAIRKLQKQLREQAQMLSEQNTLLQKEIYEHKQTEAALKKEIRHRASVEAELIEAKEAAEAANRTKSEFLARMSHELRTPLNAILGFSEMMTLYSSLSTEDREHLGIINSSGEHLLELINDILTMSKIEVGRISLNENGFNLYSLLDFLEEMLQPKVSSKDLHLTFERTPDVPQYVQGDESKLRQVLINLLENAIKFTEAGRVTLRARMGNGEESAQSPRPRTPSCGRVPNPQIPITFEVEDTGPGIVPDELDNLFEPFMQTETGRKSLQGTGLGLTISQKFVQLMGGDITVSSTPGKGTIFRFDVLVSSVGAVAPQAQHTKRRIISLAPDQPVYRILVVEDEWANRKLLVKLLTSLGFVVREAVNGQEAVEEWESWEPHLIWMDMRMPVMDGYEATKQIKAHLKGDATVIIALTASAFEEKRAPILAAGCDDFVFKPIREEAIFDKMAKHLGVRYIYEEPDQPTSLQKSDLVDKLTAQKLMAQMSPQWVVQLQQAALKGFDEVIFQLIEQIPSTHAALANTLIDWTNGFQFEKIIDLTKQIT
ncbi:MAG: response regulator [Xenococcaceae cyanobacterium]